MYEANFEVNHFRKFLYLNLSNDDVLNIKICRKSSIVYKIKKNILP